MEKIKGQGRITKLIAQKIADINRQSFKSLLENEYQFGELFDQAFQSNKITAEVVSFSSTKDYPEQILSILSFLRYVGRPQLWTVYSDGSHTSDQIAHLQRLFPFARLVNQYFDKNCIEYDDLKPILLPYRIELIDFANKHWMGKKLLSWLNHNVNLPTLFLDSDILFYSQSENLKRAIEISQQSWFLPDKIWGCLDSRYMANRQPEAHQVNVGCILINRELTEIKSGLNFLKGLRFTYEYFTEQTVLHIIFNSNEYLPFDSRLFVVDSADQFDFSYAYDRDAIALRHYTGPVRHKMWQRNWKWHLSLT